MSKNTSRRKFIKGMLSSAAIGGILPGFSAKSYARIIGANNRINVAMVGVNSRGRSLAVNFASQPNCRVSYIADVDTRAIARCIDAVSKEQSESPRGEEDFRRLLDNSSVDAFVMATPDHWHTPGVLLACQAGKHVYVEKPVSTTPDEGELLLKAAIRYPQVVIQVGNQRRSWPNVIQAIQEVHDGAIGKPCLGKGWYANNRPSIGIGKEVAVPPWLNYELWQGPAIRKPFKDNLIHYNWHWFWNYGQGELPGNGIHVLDLLRWGMQVDFPVRVSSTGGRYRYNDDWETPDTQIVNIEFENNMIMTWEGRSCNGTPLFDNTVGLMFYGEKGSLLIGAGDHYTIFDLKGKVVKAVDSQFRVDPMNQRRPSQLLDALHIQDFFSGIRDGTRVRGGVDDAHKSTLLCQLGNIAFRTQRTLETHPKDGSILNDSEANMFWSKSYHHGFEPKL